MWVVDPIDGTACFLAGIPTWCVSIAWMVAGEPAIGVIYDPNADELFAACRGQGASVNGAPVRAIKWVIINAPWYNNTGIEERSSSHGLEISASGSCRSTEERV